MLIEIVLSTIGAAAVTIWIMKLILKIAEVRTVHSDEER